jgi:ABC-type Fe3+-hydroxamate transport system substrate-binding protein
MRLIIAILFVMLVSACSTYPTAREGAVYDTVTTVYAVEHLGARELNPLGVWGTILGKVLLISYYNDRPPAEQASFDRRAGAFWTAASVSNLVQIMAAPGIFISVGIGATVGYYIYINYPTER